MRKTYKHLLKKCNTLFSIALMGILVVSCMDKDVYKGDDQNDDSSPNLFDFSTKSDLKISLDYATNYPVSFECYYVNPLSLDEEKSYVKNAEMKPFITGKTDATGKFSITFSDMPNSEKDIYVYSPNLTVPTLLHATVNGGEVVLTTASKVASLPKAATRASASGSFYSNWTPQRCTYNKPLGSWDTEGNASYLNTGDDIDKHKLQITEKFKRTIAGTLEVDEPVLGKYLTHEVINISEDANVYINFVSHNNSERNNALAYYTLAPGEEEPATAPTQLAIAFPNLRAKDLKSGDVVQLQYYDKRTGTWGKAFPAGSRIGLALLVDAFQNGSLENPANVAYSNRKYNSYRIKQDGDMAGAQMANRPQMLAFMADNNLVLSFEDQPWHEARKKGQPAFGNFNDDIFTITANPITALPDDVEPGTDPEESEEEKPDMTVSSTGILAFEDNWPNQGDYDMNDVVFAYQRTFNLLMQEGLRILSIDETYTFRNNGASYINGFGYVIGGNVKRDDVEVTVISDKSYNGQGIDADLEGATVMLADNLREVPAGTTFTVRTKFKAGTNYAYTDFSFNPYNPFIVVMGHAGGDYLANNRTEVHLPKNYKPTSKADDSEFGTGNDFSLVGNNWYYISNGNYPFALEITGAFGTSDIPDFAIPTEKKRIEESYPKFIDWVKNPSANTDWWKKH